MIYAYYYVGYKTLVKEAQPHWDIDYDYGQVLVNGQLVDVFQMSNPHIYAEKGITPDDINDYEFKNAVPSFTYGGENGDAFSINLPKEIDVFIHDGFDADIKWNSMVILQEGETHFYRKAKLIIELPERKKEFTETELRDAFLDYLAKGVPSRIDGVLDKLFGDKND